MKTVALLLDSLLLLTFLASIAIIVFKAVDLHSPKLLKRGSWEDFFGPDRISLEAGMEQLEKGMTLLAVIASSAPFIGLAGTVLHIIQALQSLSLGSADMALISGPIATALNATLWGLAAAIPAAIAHALFSRRLQVLENRQLRKLAAETSSQEASA